MLITKYVPLTAAVQEVYRLLPKDQVDYNELYEFAYTAYEALMVRQVYDEQMYLATVENHTFKLPAGLVYIEQMFYKMTDTEEDLTTNVPIYIGDSETTAITQDDWNFLFSSGYRWQPLRLSPSVWSNTFVCSNSPTIGALSEHTYTITKDRCVITSFESGTVCIGGLRYPTTEDGELLIPDERDVREAIKYNVLMNYFLMRDIMQMEGSGPREEKYRRYWEIYAAKCRGKLMLMSIDQLENLRTQMQRLGQHNESYNNAFSNLSSQENINLNG